MQFSNLFKKLTICALVIGNITTSSVAFASGYVHKLSIKGLTVDAGGTLPVVNIDGTNLSSGSTAVGAARVKVAPNTVPFGSVAVGASSAPQTITVSNLGSKSAVLGTIPDAGPFKVTSNCNGVVLASLATCRFNVTFSPTEVAMTGVVGTIGIPLESEGSTGTAQLAVSGSAFLPSNPASLKEITVTGFEGQDSALSKNAQGDLSIALGTALIHEQTSTKTFTITSTGALPVTMGAITVVGGDSSFSTNSTCPGILVAGQACAVSVVFAPQSPGNKVATLEVNSNAYAKNKISVALQGEAIEVLPVPGASLSETTKNFDNTNVGASATFKFTLNSTGTAPLSILSAPTVSGSNTFSITGNTCSGVLSVGSSCEVTVKFEPTNSSAQTGTLSVATNAGTKTADLAGTGLLSAFSLSSSSVGFSNVWLSANKTLSVLVLNTGNVALASSSIQVSGAEYAVAHTCPTSLAPAQTCTLNVTYTPGAAVTHNGSVAVSFAATAVQTVSLSGTGVAPTFSVDNTSLSFGSQVTGSNTQKNIVITNTSGVPLSSPLITTASSGYAVSNNCGVSLAAAGSCTVTVTFNPAAVASYAGSVSIGFSLADSQSVTLSGAGLDSTDYGFNFAGNSNMAVATPLPDSMDFTVEAWLKLAPSGGVIGGTVLSDVTNLSGNDTFVDITNTAVMIRADKANSSGATYGAGALGGVSYNHNLALGTALHHVVWSSNATGSSYDIYIDGQKVAGATGVKMTNMGEHALNIGSWQNAQRRFNGTISELRFYTKAMSAAEVSASYAAGRTGALGSNIAGAWNFQENTGTTVSDYSGNGRNGVLTPGSGATWVAIP